MRKVIAILVNEKGEVLDYATNEHKEPCKREGYPSGVGYELCEGCNYPNHAEYKLIQGHKSIKDFMGGTIYLIGHTYACEPCKELIEKSGAKLKIL